MSYNGEQINASSTLLKLNQAATLAGFGKDMLYQQAGYVVPVYERSADSEDAPRIYLSAGIHGDEPAGPLAVLDLLKNSPLSEKIHWTIIPILNPTGFDLNTRENHNGEDLNRDYLDSKSEEIRAHVEWIKSQKRWDIAIHLHEDWGSEGFYLYDLSSKFSLGWAEKIIVGVGKHCPIDLNEEIDEASASGGIIRPDLKNIDSDPKLDGSWAEAVYFFIKRKARCTFTFESPSGYDLPTRIKALSRAVEISQSFLLNFETK